MLNPTTTGNYTVTVGSHGDAARDSDTEGCSTRLGQSRRGGSGTPKLRIVLVWCDRLFPRLAKVSKTVRVVDRLAGFSYHCLADGNSQFHTLKPTRGRFEAISDTHNEDLDT